MGAVRRLDTAQAVRLVVIVGCLAFAGYVADRVIRVPYAWMIGVFFVGAIVAHDFVLYPVYALADVTVNAPEGPVTVMSPVSMLDAFTATLSV